jgi:transcription-repair coupling factor (superfamily II helicase)
MKDLEIRGAGHLFGEQQSGVMEAVGYEYFIHLLEQAIKELKGEAPAESKSEINLRVDNRIPETYIPQVNVRLSLYKRISSAEELAEFEVLAAEMDDRFGPPPAGVIHLLDYGRIKLLARKLRVQSIDRVEGRVVFKFDPAAEIPPERWTGLIKSRGARLSPEGLLTVPLKGRADADILAETISILKTLYGV